nr:hypothetical protein Iba_chr02dCG2150 [Ipomoea batatas]
MGVWHSTSTAPHHHFSASTQSGPRLRLLSESPSVRHSVVRQCPVQPVVQYPHCPVCYIVVLIVLNI